MNTALITGISGQDGSYLAEFLLAKGYKVFGLVRRNPETCPNLRGLLDSVGFLYGDMTDRGSLVSALHRSDPDEIYNLAGQSFVPPSWQNPEDTLDINAGGLARILSIVKEFKPCARVYQASSSEMFGDQSGALHEHSDMRPSSPYGVSKLAAHHLIQAYRTAGIKCVSGILFNHESERRGGEMVTMKIVRHVARFAKGIKEPLELGNLNALRDWGYSPDYVEAMWIMMREAKTDYVIGTGIRRSVGEFLIAALKAAGLEDKEFMQKWVQIDSRLIRPGEINSLCANFTKATTEIGWAPKTHFSAMVAEMVKSEMGKLL